MFTSLCLNTTVNANATQLADLSQSQALSFALQPQQPTAEASAVYKNAAGEDGETKPGIRGYINYSPRDAAGAPETAGAPSGSASM